MEFRKTLYGAYREVEEGLDGRRRLADSAALQGEALALAERNAKLAESRYRAGETDMQSWLEATRGERQAREKLLELSLERLKNLAYLYKALGGARRPPERGRPGSVPARHRDHARRWPVWASSRARSSTGTLSVAVLTSGWQSIASRVHSASSTTTST
ncbi:Probable efflux pump outer membrane protein ttgC precursor [Chromobacterium violaceum]|uniref:Probable efflux pump outer membrane protein ttgC n=1 Tax=Chromobacterium violaceum TaxID=536 RepID=A0A447TF31_CHRVL|nr:Probable efflux pump outer membrane protein ttgC precursor [Chromobacterium violaceum]